MRVSLVWIAACLLCASCKTDPKEAEISCKSSNFQGEEAAKAGDYKSAQKHYHQAIEQAAKGSDPTQMPKSLFGLGEVLLTEGKLDEAEVNFSKALSLCTALSDNSNRSASHSAANSSSASNANSSNTEKISANPNQIDINQERVNCIVKLADIKVAKNQTNDAVKLYRDALALCKSSGGAVEASTHITKKLAQLLHSLHQEDEADDLDAEALAETLTTVESKSMFYQLNSAETKNAPIDKDPHERVRKLKALIIVAKRMQKTNSLRVAYEYLGRTEMKRGHFNQAETAFKKTVEGLKAGVDEVGVFQSVQANVAMELTELACLAELRGNTAEADKLFQQASKSNFVSTVVTLSDEAETFPKQAFIDRLAGLLEHASVKEQKAVDQNQVADAIGRSAARALDSDHDYPLAERRFKLAIEIYKRTVQFDKSNGVPAETPMIEMFDSMYGLGHAYVLQNKIADADATFDRGLVLINSMPGNHDIKRAQIALGRARTNRVKGNFAESELQAKKSLALFDKVLGPKCAERNFAISELNAALAKNSK